jgi:Flp pilus assembly protein TadG
MIPPLFKKFLRSRRAATAVAMAIMTVPLLIAASSAVDFARIASARTLLQASVDSAAVAGAGAYQTSQAFLTAQTAANDIYLATGEQLPNFVTAANPPVIGAYCNSVNTSIPCDKGSSSTGALSANCPNTWTKADEYCVVVTQTVTLKNSLFAWIIPTEALSVQGVATTAFPPDVVNGGNFPPSPGFGSAGDQSFIAAYGVPPNPDGTNNFGGIPSAAGCGSIPGVNLLPGSSPASSTTPCQFLFVADSFDNNAGASGSLTLSPQQPIAFLFINDTGAENFTRLDAAQYTTNLLVSTNSNMSNAAYDPDGFTTPSLVTTANPSVTTVKCNAGTANCPPPSTATTTTTPPTTNTASPPVTTSTSTTTTTTSACSKTSGSKCTQFTTTASSVTTTTQTATLYGTCPDHTLYGSLSTGFGAPQSDSLNVYSSAFEVLGYPPTQFTNHVLTPFVSNSETTEKFNNKSYFVESVCPNYPRANTAINAPVSTGYTNSAAGITSAMTGSSDTPPINIFSTWFPAVATNDVVFSDTTAAPAQDSNGANLTSGRGDVFPPGISGCTPATHTTDNGVTQSSTDPWWSWSPSNYNNCGNAASEPQSTATTSYNNCALLLQPLGGNVPTTTTSNGREAILPDYYNIISTTKIPTSASVLALDPVYDGISYTDPLSGLVVSNSFSAGTVPGNAGNAPIGSTQIPGTGIDNKGLYAGDFIVSEAPAANNTGVQDHNLPLETSFQCYNPQANGNTHGTVALGELTNQSFSDNNNDNNPTIATTIDRVANPQDGAIICNSPNPQTYALYWNDLGNYETDDLGYWNAVDTFTCSTPATTNRGGGPATLSG